MNEQDASEEMAKQRNSPKKRKSPPLPLRKKKVLKWRLRIAWIYGEIGGYRSVWGRDFFFQWPNGEQNSLDGLGEQKAENLLFQRSFSAEEFLLLGHFGGSAAGFRR